MENKHSLRIGDDMFLDFDSEEEMEAYIERRRQRRAGGKPPESRASKTPPGDLNGGSSQAQRDQGLLRTLVNAAETGVEASTISGLLGGIKGRGIPPAVRRWAVRVGLADDEDNEACLPVRVNRKRGWRLSPSALGAARAMQGGKT